MPGMILHAARLAISVPLLLAAGPVLAGQNQPQYQTMPVPTPDADALAAEMRILGSNPFDLPALISAGERTLKLGDMEAAAAFFQRAERISPNNGRIKAGKARTLVQLGRPGEALRQFNEAESLGYGVSEIAADHALAYDLIGEQERAQRLYRQALKRQSDDETQRRYALSLGISGKRDQALEALDVLLRRSDRAAWRVRAFVLAMNGDVAGANRIAVSMLPGDMAEGLAPFFQILPTLSLANRAFAVHFGEVRPTPERIADARMIPDLPVLAPEPVPVVQVAAVDPRSKAQQRRDRNRRRNSPVEVATLVPPKIVTPSQLPPPPRVVMSTPQVTQPTADPTVPSPVPAPMRSAPVVSAPPVITRPAANQPVAAVQMPEVSPPVAKPLPTAPVIVTKVPEPAPVRPTALPPVRATASAIEPAPAPAAPPAAVATSGAASPQIARANPVVVPPQPLVTPAPAPSPIGPPESLSAVTTTNDSPAVVQARPAEEPAATDAPSPPVPSRPKPVASDESVLARIISTIGVPAAELEVAPVKPVASPSAGALAAPIDTKAAAKKALADKAAAEKKIADKKLADEKAAKAKALKADPPRIWVQVAGGSSVRDLPKEWARLRAKASAAFQSRSPYTTPLRFTNRLLTGPFKSEDEAQSFVNQIARFGLTGFVFNSEAGQKIDKLPAK
ncbi:SPOR domain-containing protein [Sphingomonas sp. 28-62-11]|uniref:SPOR domain-containing protein n=1 Tax=Sphingomonas sp. 28-62-11 TaxID=1970432 RepID=UPI0035A9210E